VVPRALPADRGDSDLALIGAVARGEVDALAGLYDRYADELFGVTVRILSEAADAEEIVADAFTRLWRSADRYDAARGSVAAWLVTIARNRAIDRLRTRRARHETSRTVEPETLGLVAVAGDDPERAASRAEYRENVRSALNALSIEQRRAIDLALYGGLSHSEIAHSLGEPLGTIKTRIRTGMEKLKATLAPLYRDEFA
jgi:RNA polymerase sigma-70 factor (ECF subfamily)